jgi:hypothetical protein
MRNWRNLGFLDEIGLEFLFGIFGMGFREGEYT